jgi:5-methyltetrahydrofolate--homocysteine methyltransferase
METLTGIRKATVRGDRDEINRLIKQALKQGIDPQELIREGFIPAMTEVGDKFSVGEFFLPEMLLAARAMKMGMEQLEPLLVDGGTKKEAKIILSTVLGDRHDIGKNLVGIMMEGAGLEVLDLGVDVPPEKVIEAVKLHKPDFVCLSALLTTTMNSMEETVAALTESGLRDQVKVFVGGAPVSQNFADQIGADGYGKDAAEAVRLAKSHLG